MTLLRTSSNIPLLIAASLAALFGNEVPAATVFPIVTNNADTAASVASDGTNYLVGIQGDYLSPDTYAITAQMFGRTGATIGSRINPAPGHAGGNPAVACSGTNYLMVWPDDYLNGNNSSLSGQILSPSGALIGSWFPLTVNSAQAHPAVAYGGGKYLVVWDDYRSGANWAIYGRLVSSSGALLGSELVICAPANGQDEKGATVAFDGTNFLVVWQFNSTSGGNHNVTYGVFVSPSGTMGTPFAIGQTVSLDRNPLAVVFNGTNYLAVWNYDSQLDGSGNAIWNLYGRFVTPAGAFPGNEFAILTNGNPRFPVVGFDGANYLLSWNQNLGATNSNVYFQFLNPSAQPIGCQFTPFSAQGNQVPLIGGTGFDGNRFVAICTVSAGGFTPTPENNSGVYGTLIPRSTAAPQLAVAAPLTLKRFSLSLAGTPGINYAIQGATNFSASSWTSVATNSPTNDTFTFKFTDTAATNPARFYRAVKH